MTEERQGKCQRNVESLRDQKRMQCTHSSKKLGFISNSKHIYIHVLFHTFLLEIKMIGDTLKRNGKQIQRTELS